MLLLAHIVYQEFPTPTGLLDEQRMYQLIRQQGPIDDRMFAIAFLERGAEAFAFTFG